MKSTARDVRQRFCGEACYVADCHNDGLDVRRCSAKGCNGVAVPGTRAGAECQQCWRAAYKLKALSCCYYNKPGGAGGRGGVPGP